MLDHPKLQRATAQVIDGGATRGTAWYCGDGIALTSAHVVGSLNRSEITLPEMKLRFPSGEVTATAREEDIDFRLDIALLRIVGPVESLTGVEPIPIADPTAAQMQEWMEWKEWEAWGFPKGHPVGLFLEGKIVSLHGLVADAVPAIQMRSGQKPYDDLVNSSGSAVIANGVAIGLIRKFTPNMQEGAVFAAPLREGKEGFPELQARLLQGRRALDLAMAEKKREEEARAKPSVTVNQVKVIAGDHSCAFGGDNKGNITINNK